MTPEEIHKAQDFFSTTGFSTKRKKLFEIVVSSRDTSAEHLAMQWKQKDDSFKDNISKIAGMTTAKIFNNLFMKPDFGFDITSVPEESVKSDHSSLPNLWKDSFNRQQVSFTIKRAFPRFLQGEIELDGLNEEEKLSTFIKIIRANADFVINGIPKLERQHFEKIQESKRQELGVDEATIVERHIYELWQAGMLQCDLDRS